MSNKKRNKKQTPKKLSSIPDNLLTLPQETIAGFPRTKKSYNNLWDWKSLLDVNF